jgi:hypothetical protein
MKCLRSLRLVGLFVLVSVCAAAGCGKKLPSMSPVSGKVTVDNKPLTGGQVTLMPEIPKPTLENAKPQSETVDVGISSGQIASDGTYKIFTAGKEGAPLGKYKITVTPTMMPSSDPKVPFPIGFNQRFANPRDTPLRFEVVASPAAGAYDLKVSK